MERSCQSRRFLSLLLAGPLPERRVMIYLGSGLASGARGLSEHIPPGGFANETPGATQLHTL